MIHLENVLKISLQDVLKMSWRCLQNFLKTSWICLEDVFQDVLKMSWRRLEDIFKTSWRSFCKTSWRHLENVLKTSWRRLEEVWPRRIYWSWPRRLEDVLKTSSEEMRLRRTYSSWWRCFEERRFQDVFWRRRRKTLSDVFIKTNVCFTEFSTKIHWLQSWLLLTFFICSHNQLSSLNSIILQMSEKRDSSNRQ